MASSISRTALYLAVCCLLMSHVVPGHAKCDHGSDKTTDINTNSDMTSLMSFITTMYNSGKASAAELGNALLTLLKLIGTVQKPPKTPTTEAPLRKAGVLDTSPRRLVASGDKSAEVVEVSQQGSLLQSSSSSPLLSEPLQASSSVLSPFSATPTPTLESSIEPISSVERLESSEASSLVLESESTVFTDLTSSSTLLPDIMPSSSLDFMETSSAQSDLPERKLANAPSSVDTTTMVTATALKTTTMPTVNDNGPQRRVQAPTERIPLQDTTSPSAKATTKSPDVNQTVTSGPTPGEWGSWGECSPACGGCGKRTRSRNCSVTGCSTHEEQERCGFYPCPGRRVKAKYYCYKPVVCPQIKFPGKSGSPYPGGPSIYPGKNQLKNFSPPVKRPYGTRAYPAAQRRRRRSLYQTPRNDVRTYNINIGSPVYGRGTQDAYPGRSSYPAAPYTSNERIYRTSSGQCLAYTICETEYNSGPFCCEGHKLRGDWCMTDAYYNWYIRYYPFYHKP